MSDEVVMVMLSTITMISGVVVIMVGLRYRAQMRELRHRERMALIERGLVPPPEFEPGQASRRGLKQRSLSFGIIVVGLGFALMFLIGVAGGALDTGIGVGGAIAILGAAFIVRSLFATPPEAPAESPVVPPSVPAPTDQPPRL